MKYTLLEGTTPQFKRLIKLAKQQRIETVRELEDLIMNEFEDESQPITGADFEIAKKVLRLSESNKMKSNLIKLIEAVVTKKLNESKNDYNAKKNNY